MLSIKFEKSKTHKKKINKELIPIAWHPKRWWHFYMSKMRKKKEPIFKDKIVKVSVGRIQYGVTETFWDRKLCMHFLVPFFGQNVSKYSDQFSLKIIHEDLI